MANRLRSPHAKTLGHQQDNLLHEHVISAGCAELASLSGNELDFISRLCQSMTKIKAAFTELGLEPDLSIDGPDEVPFSWLFNEADERSEKVRLMLMKIAAARQQILPMKRNQSVARLRHLTGE